MPPRHAADRPNILVIFGDDIGLWNISAYNRGAMGYRTPNIDRIANEGVIFTDAYADQSCTAGRSSFLLGQSPIRTGLYMVGFPGDLFGISMNDPTLANLLHERGYACAQFGKNHLGDRDWHLPTMHGFDRFFGNLYHLNSEEEPEDPDFPEHPRYPRPRGVLRCTRTAGGPVPAQEIEDTGPLTIERMPGIDEEFLDAAMAWIREQDDAGTPWFTWFNTSRMHVWTRLKAEAEGVTGLGLYPDGMVEHDGHVGQLLDLLDELDLADDTIVIYSTDNGAEVMTWPDGGATPYRGEKASTWEGGFRVPMMARWPGHFAEGTECNGITSMLDWLPTLMHAAGWPGVKRDLRRGAVADGRPWRAHLDGYDLLPALTGHAHGDAGQDDEAHPPADDYLGYDDADAEHQADEHAAHPPEPPEHPEDVEHEIHGDDHGGEHGPDDHGHAVDAHGHAASDYEVPDSHCPPASAEGGVHLPEAGHGEQLPEHGGDVVPWPRREFFYTGIDGSLAALRFDQWKLHFRFQGRTGFASGQHAAEDLTIPIIVNLRSDPFEAAQEENAAGYIEFMFRKVFLMAGAAAIVGAFAVSLGEWPPNFGDPPAAFEVVTGHVADSPVVKRFAGGADHVFKIAALLRTAEAD
jgi:arylsulfatase A-like enzyme